MTCHSCGDGTGSFYVPGNLLAYEQAVLKRTGPKRVALYMADGGFSVEGSENLQVAPIWQLGVERAPGSAPTAAGT